MRYDLEASGIGAKLVVEPSDTDPGANGVIDNKLDKANDIRKALPVHKILVLSTPDEVWTPTMLNLWLVPKRDLNFSVIAAVLAPASVVIVHPLHFPKGLKIHHIPARKVLNFTRFVFTKRFQAEQGIFRLF
jgi:hypothetical protein